MKSRIKIASIAALTAATLALPAAAVQEDTFGVRPPTKSGAKASTKPAAKCAAKNAQMDSSKVPPQYRNKCAPK